MAQNDQVANNQLQQLQQMISARLADPETVPPIPLPLFDRYVELTRETCIWLKVVDSPE